MESPSNNLLIMEAEVCDMARKKKHDNPSATSLITKFYSKNNIIDDFIKDNSISYYD